MKNKIPDDSPKFKHKKRYSISYTSSDKNNILKPKKRNSLMSKTPIIMAPLNVQPISKLFKNDPITLELIKSIQSLHKKNINEDEFILFEEENPKYIIKNIIKLIKAHRGLYFFFTYNRIFDDKIIYKIASHIQFEQREEKSYIWEEGDNSERVYFLLKGKIAFIKNGNKAEKEKFSLNENNIFGMLDIIYERKRKLSCLCVTECSYIFFEKEFFKKYMEDKINKTDSEKKSFLVKFFNSFITIPLIKLERFISNYVELLFFQKSDLIYKEGDKNKCLYLIFNGEANLIKNINKGEFFVLSKINQSMARIQEKAKNIDYVKLIKTEENNNNKKNENKIDINKKNKNLEFLLDKANYKIMSTLSRGSVGGLEITTGSNKFKYSLVSNSNFCSVIKINIEYLEDEHLKMLMINLLPIFIRAEKKIHLQIKNIKYIDHHIVPASCQKYKDLSNLISNNNNTIDNNSISEEEIISKNITTNNNNNHNINLNISPNDYENDRTYQKIIQKIDDKFDINEGGFIKMNNINMNLCKKKYFLKEQIKDSRRLDIKIYNYIKKYKKDHGNNLKCSSVKMNYLLSDGNIKSKKDNFFELILSKHRNKNTKKSHSKSELVWKFPSPRNKRHSTSTSTTLYMNYKRRNIKIKKKKIKSTKITKHEYYKRINDIFEDIYNKAYLRKDYSKNEETEDHKLVSLQLIREGFDRNQIEEKKNLLKKSGDFIKEIIIIKGKACKEEGTSTYDINDKLTNNNTINSDNSFSINYNNKKCVTQLNTISEFDKNKNNNENEKNGEKLIKIVNNKYIRDLFYKNSDYSNFNKNKYKNKFRTARKNLNNIQNKNNNYTDNHQKNRIIFYDTGHFDMPLASKLTRIKNDSIK